MEKVESLHFFRPGPDICQSIIIPMPDMELRPGRIGKHLQAIELVVLVRIKSMEFLLFPTLLPFFINVFLPYAIVLLSPSIFGFRPTQTGVFRLSIGQIDTHMIIYHTTFPQKREHPRKIKAEKAETPVSIKQREREVQGGEKMIGYRQSPSF